MVPRTSQHQCVHSASVGTESGKVRSYEYESSTVRKRAKVVSTDGSGFVAEQSFGCVMAWNHYSLSASCIASEPHPRIGAKPKSIGCTCDSIEALHVSGTLVEPPALTLRVGGLRLRSQSEARCCTGFTLLCARAPPLLFIDLLILDGFDSQNSLSRGTHLHKASSWPIYGQMHCSPSSIATPVALEQLNLLFSTRQLHSKSE